jgi:hypothetical protein
VTSASTIALYTGHGTSLVNIGGDFRGFSLVNRLPATSIFGSQPLGEFWPMRDENTGITMALVSFPQYYQVRWEVCALWGVDVTDYRRLIRVLSYAS